MGFNDVTARPQLSVGRKTMKLFQQLFQILTIATMGGPTASAFQLEQSRLFHAGRYDVLKQNIAAGNIPAPAWQTAIFGKSTNFDLPDYRKGLYGAETVAGVNLYLMYQLLAGHTPWVMVIDVKKTCFSSSYDSSYSVTEGPFAKWILQNANEAELKRCREGNTWNLGTFFDVSRDSAANLCVGVLERFLRDQRTSIAYDLVNPDSWYIRDRKCIAKIEGTSDEALRALLENRIGSPRQSRVENWYGDSFLPGSFYAGNTIYLLRVLASSHHLRESVFEDLDGFKAEIDAIYTPSENPRSLRLDRNLDNPKIVSLFLSSLLLEIRKGPDQVKKWQIALQVLLNDLETAFGKSCHGRHGVAAENRRSCHDESDRESLKLIRFLDRM